MNKKRTLKEELQIVWGSVAICIIASILFTKNFTPNINDGFKLFLVLWALWFGLMMSGIVTVQTKMDKKSKLKLFIKTTLTILIFGGLAGLTLLIPYLANNSLPLW